MERSRGVRAGMGVWGGCRLEERSHFAYRGQIQRGPSGIMPCDVRRAALALGCSLFGRVMTVSEPPKVNDVHKCVSQ